MTEFLQQHAGRHFTLSIVELALFTLPDGGFLVQPRVLARTTNIVRGVIGFGTSGIAFPAPITAAQTAGVHGVTITQERFFEELEKSSPGMSQSFAHLLSDLEAVHVRPDYSQKTVTLRWLAEDSTSWNLGTVVTSGEVWMDYHAGQARNLNRLDASKRYIESLAALVPGAYVRQTKSQTAWNLANRDGRSMRIEQLLADDQRRSGWLGAIRGFQLEVKS